MKDQDQLKILLHLWNTFDPIGVYENNANWPDDEYKAYAETTLVLLKKNCDFATLHTYINRIVKEHMLLTHVSEKEISDFVGKLLESLTQF